MYQRYYGLRESPFELTPNPKFLFLTPRHREALSNVRYAISARKSLAVMIGEAGTGKTTLLRTALASDAGCPVKWVYLNNPLLSREDFVRTLAMQFELGPEAGESKATFLNLLEHALLERRSQGQISALIVDEAQSLDHALLEEIRLLANIETTEEKLLVVILAGQPEFAARLNEPALRQLKQRVALRCELAAFDLSETAAYIVSRLETAGGTSRLFTREAVIAVHEHSHGIPRTVNVICDNALLSTFAMGRKQVDRDIVLEVVRDFDLKAVAAVETRFETSDAAPAEDAPRADLAPQRQAPAQRPAVVDTPPSAENAIQAGVRRRRFVFFGARG
ncbi:MAG TPA: AAA family ATPase [Vicinamibacterales bacterium]